MEAFVEVAPLPVAAGILLVESAGGTVVARGAGTGERGHMSICASNGRLPLERFY